MTFTAPGIIRDLSKATALTRGTSLVTLHVPGYTSISLATSHLNSELSSSTCIKDRKVGKSVNAALRSGLQKMKKLGHIAPENGFVLCAGEIESCV
jgi:peptide subunit release factor 1 (eRF1)